MSYSTAANANGSASLTVVLKDDGGTANGGVDTTPEQTFTINVAPVNDAPVNFVPFGPSTNQQTPIVFSTTNLNAFSVDDADAATDNLQVTLSTVQGTLLLGSISGITFITGDGVDDATMAFTGTKAAINSCLNGLTFKPNQGFSGTATIQLITDDLGHNGSGGPKSATSNVYVTVRSGGRLQFNTATYGVNENGGTATITVLRASGSAGTVTVNYSTSSGTAIEGTSCRAGIDYITTSGTFSWTNGDTSPRNFVVPICNDSLNEVDETINLTISDAVGTGSLGVQTTATLTVGNDDAPVILTEENTQQALALDLVSQTGDPFTLTNMFNLSTDHRRRVSLFVWHLGLLPADNNSSVKVVAEDDEGRVYDLPVEYFGALPEVSDVTQVVVRLPETVIGAPRDLWVKVTLRGPASNRAFIRIAGQ